MHKIIWYNGKDWARSIWIDGLNYDAAHDIVDALKAKKWKVVWLVHGTHEIRPEKGYEKAYEDWKKLAE